MKKTITTILTVAGIVFQSSGQYLVNHVITVAGGSYGNPGNMVKYGILYPGPQDFSLFDSIPGDFTNAALAHNSFLYSNASNTIYKHDLSSYQRVDSVPCGGIQKMAWHQNNLFVSRSTSFGATSNNIIVFDLNTLDTVTQITGFANPTTAMLVVGDSLYVAWNTQGLNDQLPPTYNFDSVGYISVVALNTLTKVRDIELGNAAGGINSLVLDKTSNKIYTGNATAASVTEYDVATSTFTTDPTGTVTASKLMSVHNGKVSGVFELDAFGSVSGFGFWDIATQTISDTVAIPGNFIAGVVDTINYNLYATQTDYFSFGSLSQFTNDTIADSTYSCGVSPEAITIDYVVEVGVNDIATTTSFTVYPNPSNGVITVDGAYKIAIKDLSGKSIYTTKSVSLEKTKIDLSFLKAGIYFMETEKGVKKLILQ